MASLFCSAAFASADCPPITKANTVTNAAAAHPRGPSAASPAKTTANPSNYNGSVYSCSLS